MKKNLSKLNPKVKIQSDICFFFFFIQVELIVKIKGTWNIFHKC